MSQGVRVSGIVSESAFHNKITAVIFFYVRLVTREWLNVFSFLVYILKIFLTYISLSFYVLIHFFYYFFFSGKFRSWPKGFPSVAVELVIRYEFIIYYMSSFFNGSVLRFHEMNATKFVKKFNSSMVRKILVKKLEVSCSCRNSKILSGRLYCCHVLCSFTFLQVPCNITFHWKEKLHFYIQRKKEIISFSFLKAGYVWMRKCSLTVKGNVKTVSIIYFTSKCESYSTHIVTISSQTPSKPSNNFFPYMRSAINLHEKTILFIIVTK